MKIWNLEESDLPISDMKKPLEIPLLSAAEESDLTSLDWNFDGSLLAIGSYDTVFRIVTATGELYFLHFQHEVG